MKYLILSFIALVALGSQCPCGYALDGGGDGGTGLTVDHLSAQWIQPSSRKVLWQVGRLDGRPESVHQSYSGEFGKETISGEIVQLNADRVNEDFPQRILPGQTIVVELPEMEKQDLLFRALSVRWDESGTVLDPTKDMPSLQILYNKYPIWTRHLSRQGFMIETLLPSSYQKSGHNILTLRNVGKIDVVFDALWVESARGTRDTVQFAIRDWDRIPDDYKEEFSWNQIGEGERMPRIGSTRETLLWYPTKQLEAALRREHKVEVGCAGAWHFSNSFVAFNQQEKVALHFLEKAIGWYFHGGSALTIENIGGVGRFFCPYTHRKYPAAFSLSAVSRVFEGDAKRLPVNVLAGGARERQLNHVYWLATKNKAGIASIIIARSRYGYIPAGKVRVLCALPWQGATVAYIYNGIFPEDVFMEKPTGRGGRRSDLPSTFGGRKSRNPPYKPYDRDRIDTIRPVRLYPNGQGGLLDIELDIQDCLLIRLVQEGAEPMEHHPQREGAEPHQTESRTSVQVGVEVSDARENLMALVKRFPIYLGVMCNLSPNYRVRSDKATSGPVTGEGDDIPEEEQSLFVDVDYKFGVPLTAEGAVLDLYAFHEKIADRVLSFWVYPHAKSNGQSVPLRMGLGPWDASVELQPGKWQRVQLHFANIAGVSDRKLVLLAPASGDELRQMDAVTFEFNGIKLLEGAEAGD